MYIHDTNAPTQNLRVPGMPEDASPVDIPESDVVDEGGVLQVPAETGVALTEHCPSINEHEPPDEDDVDDEVLDDDVTEDEDSSGEESVDEDVAGYDTEHSLQEE